MLEKQDCQIKIVGLRVSVVFGKKNNVGKRPECKVNATAAKNTHFYLTPFATSNTYQLFHCLQ